MSNSNMVVYTKISPNKTVPRNKKIDTITIHHMAGDCSIETCGNIFAPTSRKASSNYGIGSDGRVGMYVEEKDRSWCSSSSANDNRAITIEVADDSNKEPWHSSDKAMTSLVLLCVDICRRNGIKELIWTGDKNGNLTLHKWFTSTTCPGAYLESQMPKIAEEVNKLLKSGGNSFKWGESASNSLQNEPQRTPTAQTTNSSSSLKKGSKGALVSELQSNLNKVMNAKLDVDGSFGSLTEKAVKDFQTKYSLTVDGIFGKNSKAKMEEVLKSLETKKFEPYLVKVTANVLRVRKGPSTSTKEVKTVLGGGVYTIVEEFNGWGKLKSGLGWISLEYTKKV